MCYSLEASVTACIGLAIAGGGMVAKAMTHDRRMLFFALFPLVFAVHQATEGVVWYSWDHPFEGDSAFRYLYTAIAFTVWPVLTPFAAAHAETDPERRRLWRMLGGTGVVLGLYLIVKLAFADGIQIAVVKHSLAYTPMFERPPVIVHFLYVVLTVAPLVFSERRWLVAFGGVVFVTFFWALMENRPAWYSVWCMTAAAFSLIIAFAIERVRAPRFDGVEAPG
jgi:hypothetical protein